MLFVLQRAVSGLNYLPLLRHLFLLSCFSISSSIRWISPSDSRSKQWVSFSLIWPFFFCPSDLFLYFLSFYLILSFFPPPLYITSFWTKQVTLFGEYYKHLFNLLAVTKNVWKHAASFLLRHQDVVLCAHQHQNSWGAPGARHGWQLGGQHPKRVSHFCTNAPALFTSCIIWNE